MTPQIYKILRENEVLFEKLGDRIYAHEAPLKAKTPYLVWQGIGSSPENTIDCGSQADHDSYQFVIWHTNIPEAESLRFIASKALESNDLFYTGKHPDNRDPQTTLHGRGWDMNWWAGR